MSKKKRSIRGMFVQPKSQIKQIGLFMVGALISMVSISAVLFSSIQSAVNLLVATGRIDTESASILQSSIRNGFVAMSILAFCLALYGAWIGFRIIHRFYGPTVPILRTLNLMKSRDYSNRINLRKGDELTEIAHAVNALAEELSKERAHGIAANQLNRSPISEEN